MQGAQGHGHYDIIQYDDGSTEWVLQCFECNTIQSQKYDPDKINLW
ncbi:MAG: hypothetical protein J4F28_07245 [Nitrosopumilaceae archaeon]|nr:hypothetical protein [Nitrosopumilaceae archaeon]